MSSSRASSRPVVVLCAPNIPKRPTNTNRLFTLGLLYLRTAAERSGWDCRIVDAYFDDLGAADCADRIAQHEPQLVGYSVPSRLMFDAATEVHQLVEVRRSGKVACIIGGHFPTRRPKQTFEGCPSADWIVQGEGEPALEGLLRHLNGEQVELAALPGLLTRDRWDQAPISRSAVANLDVFGDYDESWIEVELSPDEWSLVTSRGCTAHCTFCVIGPHWRRYGEWRGHSADWVAERIKRLRDLGARHVQIVDDQFVGSMESVDRAWRICELLAGERDLPCFSIMCRPDTVVESPKLFAALRDVGLRTVFMGLETGSPKVAELFRKETTVELGARAVGILDQLGLQTQSGTIVFHPWMSLETLRRDIKYFRGLMSRYASFRILGLNELDILPRTPIAAMHGTDDGEWQRDWTKHADEQMCAIYRAWLGYQETILFPALEAVSRAGSSRRGRFGAARLQLDALGVLLDAYEQGTPPELAATILHVRASRFVAQTAGREGLEEYLNRFSGRMGRELELERCFEEA